TYAGRLPNEIRRPGERHFYARRGSPVVDSTSLASHRGAARHEAVSTNRHTASCSRTIQTLPHPPRERHRSSDSNSTRNTNQGPDFARPEEGAAADNCMDGPTNAKER